MLHDPEDCLGHGVQVESAKSKWRRLSGTIRLLATIAGIEFKDRIKQI